MGSKRPGGSESAARAQRGISPPEASQHRAGPAAHPERQTGLSAHTPHPRAGEGGAPLTGPHAHRHLHPEPQPARENALAPRTGGPHSPHTRNPAVRRRLPPARPTPPQGSGGTAPPGAATGRQRPGDDTHVRRGQLGPRPRGTGVGGDKGVARTGRGGRPAAVDAAGAAGRGRGRRPGDQKTPGHSGPPGKPARDPTATHTRGRSCDAWDAGRSRPSLERAPQPGPAARAGLPSSHLPPSVHPSIHPRQINLPSKSDPEAQHPGDTLSSEAAQTGPTTPPPAAAPGRGRARQAPPPHQGCGAGGAGAHQASRRDHPLPPGLTPRGGLAHTAHTHGPPTRQTPGGAQRDPPPTRRGEAQAAVGNKRHTAPPRGRRTHQPASHGGEGSFLPTCSGSRRGGHCALGRGSGWGSLSDR
ncbi:unnamed protein product [Rangifer tarandus platyrhynchus]|uniref:Uncharacterized protein n=1 Tax=Rangifer tarandus platyrhynchus TaxID=3082113 RepID=A0ABN8YI54_RANTA|nr:unnamed protein product [Rangifer tarandus platyrhynchus]